ncbi:DUF2087 domain-containing protein [bacterium]|nr:MAG: DUF2087 domain-containing protein [bacterium]
MSRDPIEGYFDREGRLMLWPSRKRGDLRQLVLKRLIARFEPEREYSEMEVNAILKAAHTFEDPALLRRELFDGGFLDRLPDGSRYRRIISEDDASPPA